MDDELRQVRSAAAALLATPVRRVVRLAGSVANRDYLIDLADRDPVVMKLGPADELAREAWACRRLSAMGLPVPSVVCASDDGGPLRTPALVLSLVEGAPDQRPEVIRSAGAVVRRIHQLPMPGFGPLVAVGGEWRGRYASWAEAIASAVRGVPDLIAAGILDADLARAAVRSATGPLVDFPDGGVLLHRDLKEVHLFGVGDRLTGLIDWGDTWVGDPLLDLARMSMAPPAVFTSFLEGYDRPSPEDLEARLAAYRIGWNLDALGYEYRAGGDWFDVYRGRVVDDVARLA